MDQIKRINKIIAAVGERLQSEVEGLLGTDFILDSVDGALLSKEDAFEELQGKQVCAQIEVSGELSGTGCLLVGIKDAIRLGGTLIMLPSSELDEVIGREDYSEEIEDSYGEIANIIAGAFTSDFEEMYPTPCRFIRKEQEVVSPTDVDIDSAQPVENQTYYRSSYKMTLEGRVMGNLVMLMPAAAFELEVAPSVDDESQTAEPESIATGESTPAESISEPQVRNEGEVEAAQEAKPKQSFEKQKKKIDQLLEECSSRMEAELSALMGVGITLSDVENQKTSKETFFTETVSGQQILADMEIVGECESKGYFAVSTKDAIYLGGTLIMLPPSELENAVKEQEFGEDTEDAYGEIVNIISGVYTAVFEEQHSSKIRFIKKELQQVNAAKVDVTSDVPIPNEAYYVSSMSLIAEGKPLGKIHMLIPAEVLQLQEELPTTESVNAGMSEAPQPSATAQPEPVHVEDEDGSTPQGAGAVVDYSQVKTDAEKHKIQVDKLLTECQENLATEVGALLGADIQFNNLENQVINKSDFFEDEVVEKQIIASLDIVGELEGEGYLSVNVSDAVYIGGTLIMLPEAELEIAVKEKNFGEDAEDAYGEIANIISGVYSTIFEEQYYKKIRFIKTELVEVIPARVETESDEPIPNQHYYLCQMDICIAEKVFGKLNMLFPLDLLDLGGLLITEPTIAEQQNSTDSATPVAPEKADIQGHATASADEYKAVETIDILIVNDDDIEAGKINRILQDAGYGVKLVSVKDNVHNYIPGQLKAVYLVMKDVNEQTFGVAIQVNSASSLPIIAAGPGWTRSKVIKAVKYGIQDILLTPASEADIQENVANNLLKLAA